MIRNLAYHCCAFKRNGEWRKNVERLSQYAHVFNGRKVVTITTGVDIEPPDVVESAFAALGDVEFIRHVNDPDLWELPGFLQKFAMLESTDPNEATFYSHAKGVRYDWDVQDYFLEPIRRWRNRMYDECLGDVGRVEAALASHATAGCFRVHAGNNPLPATQWYYAGTFFWFNHAELFARDWRMDVEAHANPYIVEAWLGRIFTLDESYCLYGDNPTRSLYLTKGYYRCPCGYRDVYAMKLKQEVKKVCRRCFKRRAEFDAPAENILQ